MLRGLLFGPLVTETLTTLLPVGGGLLPPPPPDKVSPPPPHEAAATHTRDRSPRREARFMASLTRDLRWRRRSAPPEADRLDRGKHACDRPRAPRDRPASLERDCDPRV